MTFVVGPTGLALYRYQDWRGDIAARWREAYGDDADTSPESPDGLVIDTLTLQSSQLGDAVQDTYGASFVRTAEGVAVDLLLDLFGRQRLAARSTTVDAVWWGTAATVVWSGSGTPPSAQVDTTGSSNGDRYEVTAAGTIPSPDDDGAIVAYQIVLGVDGNDYGIEFDAAETVVTAASADPLAIAEQLAAAVVSDYPTFTATAWLDGADGAVVLIEGKAAEAVTVGTSTTDTDDVAIWGGVRLAMAAEETGPQICLAGSLLTIATPAAGLEGVVNTLDGTLGRDRESDAQMKARHFDQINVGGRGTPARIRAALLDQDPSDRDALELEACRVFNNPNDEETVIDGRTLPAHSFEVVLLGDALDAEIAEVLFTQTPAGIRSIGDTEVEVEDEVGGTHTVAFTRATERYLHLELDVVSGEGFPTTGDPEAAIVAALVADLLEQLTLGQDFYRARAAGIAASLLPGIASVTVTADDTAAPGDSPTLAAADIVVASDTILRVDSSRVTVNVT